MTKFSNVKELENEILRIVEECNKRDVLEEVFIDYVIPKKIDRNRQLQTCFNCFSHFFNFSDQDDRIRCINVIVQVIHHLKCTYKAKFLFDFLEYLMKNQNNLYKIALDRLQCNELTYQKKFHWYQTYVIIRRHINRLDYKGCRDVLKSMIIKTIDIPMSAWQGCEKQIEVFCELLNYILDSNSYLMPGYLAISEIKRHMPNVLHVPWVVQGSLSKFIDRFRATVKIAMTTEKWNLMPVIHYASSTLTSAWKLDPENLRFPLNRQLPYPKEMSGRQSKLFKHILKQEYSQDFVLHVLEMPKQTISKSYPLEQELSDAKTNYF